jgi:hypothetical protein
MAWDACSAIGFMSGTGVVARAEVAAVREDSIAVTMMGGDDGDVLTCDVLISADGSTPFAAEDEVLVWWSGRPEERGVILGRIGSSPSAKPSVPDELVLEAGRTLSLRCGDGSVTIRADGKILLKGKDLVSHAKRTNRIKGGSIAIN